MPPSWPRGSIPQRLEKWVAALRGREAAAGRPARSRGGRWRRRRPTAFAGEWQKLAEQYRAGGPRADASSTEREFVDVRRLPHGRRRRLAGRRPGPARGRRPRAATSSLHPDGERARQGRPAGRHVHARALGQAQRHAALARRCRRARSTSASRSLGQRSSAVRLVSNNCQLNYKNYRALTSRRAARGSRSRRPTSATACGPTPS